jgi:hypothetical protein
MKVLEFLKMVAAGAGIIQILDEPPASPENAAPAPGPVTVSLDDLIEQKNAEDLARSVEAPELALEFTAIYKALKVTPALHGWDIDKMLELLGSAPAGCQGRGALKKYVLDLLARNNIPSQDIIKDAVSRDRALDAYEHFVFKQRCMRQDRRNAKVASLKAQVEECQRAMAAIEAAEAGDAAAFAAWLEKKIAKEEQLVDVVSLLTPEPVISIGQVTREERKP